MLSWQARDPGQELTSPPGGMECGDLITASLRVRWRAWLALLKCCWGEGEFEWNDWSGRVQVVGQCWSKEMAAVPENEM